MSEGRVELLFDALAGVSDILILPHNNPDPDAIASAFALGILLTERLGIHSHIAYGGMIGRAENKALVQYLGHPLQPLAHLKLNETSPTILVDTQPGAGNNRPPPQSKLIAVIDHHALREETVEVRFTDVRPEVGATSTILVEYLRAVDLEPEPPLATALFYGIKTDTRGLGRDAAPADLAAYLYLQPRIDTEALSDIERAQVPADYFRDFHRALEEARVYGRLILSYLGSVQYPDLTAEMAELLLRLEGSNWVVCMGVYEETLIISVRTRDLRGGAGKLMQQVVGQEGTWRPRHSRRWSDTP